MIYSPVLEEHSHPGKITSKNPLSPAVSDPGREQAPENKPYAI
jgi:hypothetical protein